MTEMATLSLGQERLWFLDQLTPNDASYNIPIALSVRGPFRRDVFQTALSDVVARQESLRTVARGVDGTPEGVLLPPGPVDVEHVDLTTLPEAEAHAKAVELTATWSNQPFDLANGPLIRVATAQINPEHHVLSLVVHHIAADGWSMGVLFNELTACYEARGAGRTPQLPPLPITYQEVARRQRQLTDADRLTYWKDKLADAKLLQLPTDRPRPPVKTSHGLFRSVELSADLMRRVRTVARACRATPFMVCLAGFQVLLGRYSGQRDFCLGSSISGRDDVDVEPLVGLFSNTLVLRGDLTGDLSFRDLVRRVRNNTLEAFSHQDIPFEQLLTTLQVERDLSRSPIFDVMFTMQNLSTGAAFRPAGLVTAQFEAGIQQAKYDLAVEIWAADPDAPHRTDSALSAQFNYNTDLYDAATVERMAGHFRNLLDHATTSPEQPTRALEMLSADERRLLTRGWNATTTSIPDGCLATAVCQQASRSPQAAAVVSDGREFSYSALVGAADAIAARLHAAGVRRGDLVGLCAPRSFATTAAILGVWLTGAGYVPLHPDLPTERLRFMAADSGIRVVAASGSPDLSWHTGDVVELDHLNVTGPGPLAAPTRHSAAATGGDVAYQMYTSGSTGVPKPVAVEHRSVRNLLAAIARQADASAADTWLSLTSLSFDISVLELMLPLTAGGRVVLASEADSANGPALARLAREQGVTHLQATPSSWQLLVAADIWAPSVIALSGGEPLPAPLAQDISRRVKKLFNVYGPTETTIWSTMTEVSDPGRVHIGGPLANTRCHVLDPHGDLAPVGVPGELWIGGAGVARGYPGRPALTARRFMPDPYGPPGGRLYGTGDRVRWRADGCLEFLGRWDNQVKLRGHRIELGEIEAALLALGVAQAAVTVREDVPGDRRLVGYVVPSGPAGAPASPDLDAGELRRQLAARLPGHMLPSALVLLDALPVTPNGKLDRAALPEPPRVRDSSGPGSPAVDPAPSHQPAGDPVQEAVAEIWREVLRLDDIGIHEDLFDLGGHSLTITQIAARIRKRLGVDVPLHLFYDESTIAAIADAVTKARG